MVNEQVIDEPRMEDGTNFSSCTPGAVADVVVCHCCGVVVAGHANNAGARAD